MATDTAPPVPAGPPDPPAAPAASTAPAPTGDTGIMAALMAAVEPARPVTATGAGARPAGDDPAAKADPDGVLDRSSPGVTSESFKAPEDLAGAGSDAAGARYKEGVFKTLMRAGATRWAKGGGTANKRLDLEKARAGAHQVKEARTTTVMKSPGLPTRNGSGGAGGGGRSSGGNSGGNSGRNSTGNGSTGTGRGGSGGVAGGGGRGSSGSNGSGGSGGGRGTSGNGGGGSPKDTSPKGPKDSGGKGKDGSSGNAGSGGKAGKDGKAGASGNGGGSTSGGSSGGNSGTSKDKGAKADLKKGGGSGQGSGGSSGSSGGSGKSGGSGSGGGSGSSGGAGKNGATGNRTPLQRSRETGHGDGSAVRNAVDHVKAYAQGTKDGYQDKKEENGKEHARLDKAHTDHKAKQQDPKKGDLKKDDPKQQDPKQQDPKKDDPKKDDPKKDDPKQQGTAVTGPDGQTLVIAPPEEGDDGVSTDVKPLLVKEIDANTLTLGTDGASGAVSRKELRNFKQYERKLEAKENHLIKVADACKQLEAAAEDEAKDCQQFAEQAKAVEGGEKLAAKLTKLADAAKAQATEAAELHKRAKRAAEMCKVVLTNIGTRYAPLYKAVVDSDETKPAELRFYNDKGSYAPAA
ncbi:hypothetical protein EDD95_8148 [Streptomyces sp. CEV 2-1]|uniref:hypothetical protein n=1 Tax=Streptomyces sp. CEV 2-1 TaxID=2485153 RepID=UPI000FB625DE|nr:hypothetical protein [Streptomyces sp. CEV 2-1]ROQ65285.1 hypothetical protein EDD95_8148 [Streptomyces sp. CEV 2-1]